MISSMEDIIYEFKNIVEESRTEDRQDYYIKLRNTLDLLEKLIEENTNIRIAHDLAEDMIKQLEDREIWSTATMEDLRTKFIPISVIQNKLNEQYDLFNSVNQKEYSQEVVNVLEELLEETKSDDINNHIPRID